MSTARSPLRSWRDVQPASDIEAVVVTTIGSRTIEERNRTRNAIVFELQASSVPHGFAGWVDSFVALHYARVLAIATCRVS
jgi:hypothetical protein